MLRILAYPVYLIFTTASIILTSYLQDYLKAVANYTFQFEITQYINPVYILLGVMFVFSDKLCRLAGSSKAVNISANILFLLVNIFIGFSLLFLEIINMSFFLYFLSPLHLIFCGCLIYNLITMLIATFKTHN